MTLKDLNKILSEHKDKTEWVVSWDKTSGWSMYYFNLDELKRYLPKRKRIKVITPYTQTESRKT